MKSVGPRVEPTGHGVSWPNHEPEWARQADLDSVVLPRSCALTDQEPVEILVTPRKYWRQHVAARGMLRRDGPAARRANRTGCGRATRPRAWSIIWRGGACKMAVKGWAKSTTGPRRAGGAALERLTGRSRGAAAPSTTRRVVSKAVASRSMARGLLFVTRSGAERRQVRNSGSRADYEALFGSGGRDPEIWLGKAGGRRYPGSRRLARLVREDTVVWR